MSFVPAFQYIIGIGVFGFFGWLLNGIKDIIMDTHIYEEWSALTFLRYIWLGMFIIYLVFGGWWLVRKYTEEEYVRGGL